MFNKDTLKHSLLKKQSLAIISIIVVGSLFGVVYASGTVVSDTGITTPSLTVNGEQIGESSFTNYNTILLNSTVAGTSNTVYSDIQISNTGDVTYGGDNNNVFVTHTGTVHITTNPYAGSQGKQISQSETGVYSISENDTSFFHFSIYKNGVFLQNLGLQSSQLSAPSNNFKTGVAMSPSGKYIAIVGLDSGLGSDRLVIFQGS